MNYHDLVLLSKVDQIMATLADVQVALVKLQADVQAHVTVAQAAPTPAQLDTVVASINAVDALVAPTTPAA